MVSRIGMVLLFAALAAAAVWWGPGREIQVDLDRHALRGLSLNVEDIREAIGEGSEAQAPMARAVVGGLTGRTLVTLVLLPVVYTLFHPPRRSAARGAVVSAAE